MGAEHVHLYGGVYIRRSALWHEHWSGRTLQAADRTYQIVIRVLAPQLERRFQIPHLANDLDRLLSRSIRQIMPTTTQSPSAKGSVLASPHML